MNPNKALWEKGDFTRIAASMRSSGEEFVEGLNIEPGHHILDLGCGDGTTALPAAQRGATVLGVDIAANLVAAGNRRAEAAGLDNLRFQQGDASDLQEIADERFDLVVSMFGAMFAPAPANVAREMVRVARPGGRIVMGNWIPGDPTLIAQVLKTSAAYAPAPPPGFISPMTWGMEEVVNERFIAAGLSASNITCRRATYVFRNDGPPRDLVQTFKTYYGPTMNAFEAAARENKADQLEAELIDLFEQHNRAGPDATEIPATFLRVEAFKP
ncbi:class I SAM-dependent methyltransferase [uncultured Brevundimonas sp.]|uniref:class I SAM-dependent methyltransferase n=1 Tax=uncultured Brevundimonas sp. TaxID=213418 RepID=UPI00262C071C|nr:class I SAM-dependent methyltransferase [uncultured Brevundimonas sp.]